MFEFFKRRRARRKANRLLGEYLSLQNETGGEQPAAPSKADEVAAQLQDAWRFMVSQHPTVPTIDKGDK